MKELIYYLQTAVTMLDLRKDSQLYRDVTTICNYATNPCFRIAVFGPFNHGKSTLLNALLGKRTLPIDLIPTTGAAIYVRYGKELQTTITLNNGQIIRESGIELLKEYAILDENRCMRSDVVTVEVDLDHPFLRTGVEFIDLPGTDDREEQEQLVEDKLLSADLIVQVLDARKLMTLGERKHLQDWLLNRGIKSIVFVVNFLNLLTSEEQKEVYHRLRFLAESFRSELPQGISNLYRVDALPALRAILKGDSAAVQITGLSIFESALMSIVQSELETPTIRLSRLIFIGKQVFQVLDRYIEEINDQLVIKTQEKQDKIKLKQKAEKLIKQGFQQSLSEFMAWLYLPKLLELYQAEIAIALGQNCFINWQKEQFQPVIFNYQNSLVTWLNKCSDFLDKHDYPQLVINLPEPPDLNINDNSVKVNPKIRQVFNTSLGQSVLKKASFILNKTTAKSSQLKINSQTYVDAAEIYLTSFSKNALITLAEYEKTANSFISVDLTGNSLVTTEDYRLQLLTNLQANLCHFLG